MCKVFGYARVSTERQSLARQIENITKVYPDAVIYSDKWTGKGDVDDRPNWRRLDAKLTRGDVVIFDSISRLSREADEGVRVYMGLFHRGIELRFLNEAYCNSELYRRALEEVIPTTGNEIADLYIEATNKAFEVIARNQIKAAFEQAQKEREDIAQRVKDGMKAKQIKAAEKGVVVTYGAVKGVKLTTKKSVAVKQIIMKHSRDFGGSLSDPEVIRLAGVSRNSYYKYKSELKQEA